MKKNIVPTPHDRFFKASLSEPMVAKEFLEEHLPEKTKALLDLNTITLCPGSFVDEALQLQESDVLFSVNFKNGKKGYIYTLLEHQRNPDRLMPFRRLQYTVKIIEQDLQQKKEKNEKNIELPVVYTLVLYNGEYQYSYSTDFFDLFGENKALAKEAFLQPIHLIDLTQIPDTDLMHHTWSGMMQLALKNISQRDLLAFLDDAILGLWQEIERRGGAAFINALLKYMFAVGEVGDTKALKQKIHNKLSPEIEVKFMTLAQQFEQNGRQEGIQEGTQIGIQKGTQIGIQKGRQEAIQELAAKMLREEILSEEKIAAMTGLSLEIIQSLNCKVTTN